MADNDENINTSGWLWLAPDYFNKWRIFPRIFISVYLWLVYYSAMWFMTLEDPSNAQAGFLSVIIGAGAAWFGLYVSSGNSQAANPRVFVNNVPHGPAEQRGGYNGGYVQPGYYGEAPYGAPGYDDGYGRRKQYGDFSKDGGADGQKPKESKSE